MNYAVLTTNFICFVGPCGLIPNKICKTDVILRGLFPSVRMNAFNCVFSVPLLVVSILMLKTGLKTHAVITTLFAPLTVGILSLLSCPSRRTLRRLSPARLLNNDLGVSSRLVLASIVNTIIVNVNYNVMIHDQTAAKNASVITVVLRGCYRVHFSGTVLLMSNVIIKFNLLIVNFNVKGPSSTARPS